MYLLYFSLVYSSILTGTLLSAQNTKRAHFFNGDLVETANRRIQAVDCLCRTLVKIPSLRCSCSSRSA